ncbi:MAG: DDE-type integrase/transposase/recombinase [Solirubrobacteraceae bacterium]
MVASGEQVPALRTLQRHFASVLNVRADGRGPDRVYGRFEAPARNELWTGDGLHGPNIGGRTAILLAFIDDYSRALVGYRWGTAEDVLRLEAALRSGLGARGVPDGILVTGVLGTLAAMSSWCGSRMTAAGVRGSAPARLRTVSHLRGWAERDARYP